MGYFSQKVAESENWEIYWMLGKNYFYDTSGTIIVDF